MDFDVSHYGFSLKGEQGNNYATELTRDYVRGKLFPGDSVRGGVAFAVEQGDTPMRMLYEPKIVTFGPGFRGTEQEVIAYTFQLGSLQIFERPIEKRSAD